MTDLRTRLHQAVRESTKTMSTGDDRLPMIVQVWIEGLLNWHIDTTLMPVIEQWQRERRDQIAAALWMRFGIGPHRAADEGFDEVVLAEIVACVTAALDGIDAGTRGDRESP